jgi:hypothetical protein
MFLMDDRLDRLIVCSKKNKRKENKKQKLVTSRGDKRREGKDQKVRKKGKKKDQERQFD